MPPPPPPPTTTRPSCNARMAQTQTLASSQRQPKTCTRPAPHGKRDFIKFAMEWPVCVFVCVCLRVCDTVRFDSHPLPWSATPSQPASPLVAHSLPPRKAGIRVAVLCTHNIKHSKVPHSGSHPRIYRTLSLRQPTRPNHHQRPVHVRILCQFLFSSVRLHPWHPCCCCCCAYSSQCVCCCILFSAHAPRCAPFRGAVAV